jgi:hypothetical protein
MDWAHEPATEHQVAQLRDLGYAMVRPLSVTEAASLIRQYKKQSASLKTAQTAPGQSPRITMRTPAESAPPTQIAMMGTRVPPPVAEDAPAAESVARLEFWVDTCRELKDMRIASVKIYELRQRFGFRFHMPSCEQVEEILGALDGAMPAWEQDNPELFFQTLELNFPDLVR